MDQNIADSTRQHSSGSCSPFWITNICLSLINGESARERQYADLKDDKEYQDRITRLKNQYEDTKEIMETAFKLHLKEQQREYSNIQTELKLDLDLQKDEVRMFRKGWPLKLSLQALQEIRHQQNSLPESLNIIIASHENALAKGDPLTQIYDGYDGLVDNIQSILSSMGIQSKSVLRFREGDFPKGGAALANIYAMMSNMPSVMLMPRVDRTNKKLVISIGCWAPSSIIPMQRKIFELDYHEAMMINDAQYRIKKQKEIETAYLSIAGISNDMYSLTVFGKVPIFGKYCADMGICQKYPLIGEYIKGEYSSLLDSAQTKIRIAGRDYDSMPILFNEETRKKIESYIRDILKSLNR